MSEYSQNHYNRDAYAVASMRVSGVVLLGVLALTSRAYAQTEAVAFPTTHQLQQPRIDALQQQEYLEQIEQLTSQKVQQTVAQHQNQQQTDSQTLSLDVEQLSQNPELLHRALSSAMIQGDVASVELLLPVYLQHDGKDHLLVALSRAVLAYDQGKYAEAIAYYQQAQDIDASHSMIAVGLAQAQRANGALKSLEKNLDQLEQQNLRQPNSDAEIVEQKQVASEQLDVATVPPIEANMPTPDLLGQNGQYFVEMENLDKMEIVYSAEMDSAEKMEVIYSAEAEAQLQNTSQQHDIDAVLAAIPPIDEPKPKSFKNWFNLTKAKSTHSDNSENPESQVQATPSEPSQVAQQTTATLPRLHTPVYHDDALQSVIEDYRRQLKQEQSWQGAIHLGYGYDKNINRAGRIDRIQHANGEWQFPQAKAGQVLQFRGSVSKNHVLADYWSWQTDGFVTGRYYPQRNEYKQYDDLQAYIASGLQYQQGKQQYLIQPYFKRLWFAGDGYQKTVGLDNQWRYQHQFNDNAMGWLGLLYGKQTSLNVEIAKERHDTRSFLDGYYGRFGINQLWYSKQGQYALLAGEYSQKNAQDDSDRYQRTALRSVLGGTYFSTQLAASFEVADKQYKGADLWQIRRKDREYLTAISVSPAEWRLGGYTPKLQVQWQRVKSNHFLYDLKQHGVMLQWQRNFA